jgi:hypothetical protein
MKPRFEAERRALALDKTSAAPVSWATSLGSCKVAEDFAPKSTNYKARRTGRMALQRRGGSRNVA